MSSLRERLGRVRGDAAGPASSAVQPDPPSLKARLQRLAGARDGRSPVSPPPAGGPGRGEPDEAALAARLGAERLARGVLRLVHTQPATLPHGHCRLQPEPAGVELLLPGAPTDPARWIAIDTETSGLAGGTGTWVFVLGLARWQAGRVLLCQYLLTRLDAEAVFLGHVAAELAHAELLLSYNGKSFDLPLLAARLRLAGVAADGLFEAAHLDLLHPVRRAFATRWPDCRLASVERRLLGHRRIDDLPGAEAPAAWLDWLRTGDGRRLTAVLAHNRTDLLSVLALPGQLAAVHRAPVGFGADPLRLARWRLARGDAVGARALLSAVGFGDLVVEARRLLARLHERCGDRPAALRLWGQLAAADDPAAHEALAKHFEHRQKDPARALAHARRLPPSAARELRCMRLLVKAGVRAASADA